MGASDEGYKEFVERLENICEKYAEKTAITFMRNDDTKTLFTFGEIIGYIRNAKEKFAKVGLKPGDRAVIIAPHSPFAIITGLSLAYSNITSVLIDASLPAEEINRLLELSDVHSVITTSDIYETLDKSMISNIPAINIATVTEGIVIFSGSSAEVNVSATTDPHLDVIAILFSSGTTDRVKGVMVTYTSIVKSTSMIAMLGGMNEDATFLFVLPYSHISGLSCAIASLFYQCELGMIENLEATKLSKGFLQYNPTHFSMVPRVYEVIEQKIRQEFHRKGKVAECIVLGTLSFSGLLRRTLHINIGKKMFKKIRQKVFGENIYGLAVGATPAKDVTTKFFLNLGVQWANTYATTETGVPATSTGDFDNYPIGNEGSVKRFEGIHIKIHNPDEKGIGEIRVKTILIMKGYFRDPELTAAAFDEDGYLKTGDLGYIDKKDYLHVTGRIKEAIMLHTGKKVAPSDVDALYGTLCPEIAIASCGVPYRDGTYDEIHLFVERGEMSEDECQKLKKRIMDFSAETSTLYQISALHFTEKLPVTSVGKVKRFKLRELAHSGNTGGAAQ